MMIPINDSQEMLSLPPEINRSDVDFALRVVNDNMNPLLFCGDMLIIKAKSSLLHGDFGIFQMDDGIAHLKRFFVQGTRCRLESLDPHISDIYIDSIDSLHCIGKLIRVLHPTEYNIAEV